MRHSPRKNPEDWQKEKKDKAKQPEKIMDLEAEELHDGMEELDAKEGEPITRLPEYIPSVERENKSHQRLRHGKKYGLYATITRIGHF